MNIFGTFFIYLFLFPDNSLFYFILLYILFSTFSGIHVCIMCTGSYTLGFLIWTPEEQNVLLILQFDLELHDQ